MATTAAPDRVLPLTRTQHGMLFHCLYHPQENLYQVQASFDIQGRLDAARLKRAVAEVTRRHAMLRTTFSWRQRTEPVQVVHADPGIDWRELNLTGMPAAAAAQREASFLEFDRLTGFELEERPPVRWSLVRLTENSALLVFTHHHLVADGWSVSVLMRDIADAYGERLQPEGPHFGAYLNWLTARDTEPERDFWQRQLRGLTDYTNVPIGRLAGDENGERGYVSVRPQPALPQQLRALARGAGVSPVAVMHAAWALALSRCGAGAEVVSGAVLAGRPELLDGAHDMVGNFINTVPLSVPVRDDLTVAAWLRLVDERLAAVRPMQFASLAEIKEYASVREELFDNVVVYEAYPIEPPLWDGIDVGEPDIVEFPHYPLTLVLRPGPPLEVVLRYDGRRFTSEVATRLLGYFTNALEALVTLTGAGLVGEVEVVSDVERAMLLSAWAGPDREQAPRCVPDLIHERIVTAPAALAVVHGDRRLSYWDLGAMAARIAGVLREGGAGPGDVVGVHMRHCPELLASLLAVWQIGAAYLPMDPAQPAERLYGMLDDAGAKVVLCTAESPWEDALDAAADATPLPFTEADPEATAYVIYTSGSTGKPNGAIIDHRALANYIAWSIERYCDRGSGALLHSSVGFDLTVTTLFAPLAAGEPVIIADGPDELMRVLSTTIGLSFVKLTPSHMEMLAQRPGADVAALAATVWVIGGEALNYSQLTAWLRANPHAEYVNEYGPTEATVGCCVAWARRDVAEGAVAIGAAIPGSRLYILDERMRPVPHGVPGELYIGGPCLAQGYLNRSELTAAKFPLDPWRAGEHMYRTADLVCAANDGTLYYLGRRDDQVKIRGHRVELGEIESALRSAGVLHCKVLLREDPQGNARLVAWVVGNGAAAREAVRGVLPDYMIPEYFVELDRLPLTVNEKVDTRGLPSPKWQQDGAAGEPPQEGTERELADLWAQVLSCDGIGRDDDFFDLGGHSLTGTRLSAEIDARFRVQLPLSTLFDLRTVARMSAWIDENRLENRLELEGVGS